MAAAKEEKAPASAEEPNDAQNGIQTAWENHWGPSTLFPIHRSERLYSAKDFLLLGFITAAPISMLSLNSALPLSPWQRLLAMAITALLATCLLMPLAKISSAYGLATPILLSSLLGINGAKVLSALRALWAFFFFAEITVAMALLISGFCTAIWPKAHILPFDIWHLHLSLDTLLIAFILLFLQFFILKKQ